MNNPVISIIIPCYNVSEYIEASIESCYLQNYENLEVIAIDNNSTDDTWNKLKNMAQNHSGLIITREKRKGAPAARNKGLSIAKGDWIQFLDADDLLLPNKIGHQINIINNKASFIAAASIKRDINDNETTRLPNKQNVFLSLFKTSLGNTCSNLWNKKYLDKVNGWNEALKSSQEADLMFRLLKINENILYDNNPLTVIRERNNGQISQTDVTGNLERYLQVRTEIIDYIKHNKKEYYLKNETDLLNLLFNLLRKVYKHNPELATDIYMKYFPEKFTPQISNVTTNLYIKTFKIFGFRYTEKLRRIIK